MTKEVEVGDEYTGKVVKTTTFGAFVELAKGTDGLLHISNIAPGQRPATVEEVLNKGDEVSVRVVEVDRERGRIGLRLADDPDIAGKTKEELSSVGTGGGNGGGPRRDRDRGGPRRRPRPARRRRRPRPRPRAATASRAAPAARGTAAASTATPTAASAALAVHEEHRLTELESGVRIVTEHMDSVRSVALGFWIGTGSSAEDEPEAGLSHLIEHMLFRGTARYGSLEIDQMFDAMGAELNAGTGKETTSVYARVLDVHLAEAFDVMADMVWRPRFDADELEQEREIVLEEIAMYEDDPQDKVFDVLGEAVFGDHPLGRAIIGRAEVVGGAPAPALRGVPRRALRARERRRRGGRLGRPRRARRARPRRRGRAPRPGRAGAARRRRGRRPAAHALRRQGHRAVPRLPRRAGHPARRRPPLRAARPRQHPRRHVVVAAVPGGPREARPGVQRLLVPVACTRGPARSASTSARGRTTSCARWASSPTSSSACARTRRRADELARSKENVKGRIVLSLESTTARMNRLGASVLADMPLLSVDDVIERIDAVTLDDIAVLARDLFAPERMSAAGHRLRRGGVPPRARADLAAVAASVSAA